jgi:hypothetical protein
LPVIREQGIPLRAFPTVRPITETTPSSFYQIPDRARKLPLVFWHGIGQFSKTWVTTPDGREGFQNIFLRRRFSVYLIDQPLSEMIFQICYTFAKKIIMGLVRYNPNIYHRHSIRLKGYDYSREGLYFITVCIQNRECLKGVE